MIVKILYFYFAVGFLSIGRSHALESHLICKSVQDVFSPSSSGESISGAPQGPPGKRCASGSKGEAGSRGEKGDAGSPAIVNYQRIEEAIERSATEKTTELTQSLQNNLNRLNEVVSCMQTGGYASDNNCFTVIKTSANYQKAFQICADIGEKLADIHSREEEDALEYFVRQNQSKSILQFWLGMTYQHSTKSLLLSNGASIIDDFKWHPGYPHTQTSKTKMLLQVLTDPTAEHQGIWNYFPSHTGHGVICMKPLAA